MKNHTITAQAARDLRGGLPDTFNSDDLDWSQIVQLIEQSAPFSDMLVLKNLVAYEFLRRLEEAGFYVNTLHDSYTNEHYTVVRWNPRRDHPVKLA